MAKHNFTGPKNKGLNSQFASLRRRFVQRFSADCDRLVSLCEGVEAHIEAAGSADLTQVLQGPLQEMRHLLHSLAGTSGTFGFLDTGEKARELLSKLDLLTGQPTSNQADIRALLAEIRAFASGSLDDESNLQAPVKPTAPERRQDPVAGPVTETKPAWLLGSPDERREMSNAMRTFGFSPSSYRDLASLSQDYHQALKTRQPPALVLLNLDLLGLDPRQVKPLAGLDPEGEITNAPTLIAYSERDDFTRRLIAVRLGAGYFVVKPLDFSRIFVYWLRDLKYRLRDRPRVMIVEDDQILAGYLASILQARDIRCTLLSSPESIIERASEFKPDLVLMDLDLGDVKGDELAAILRQKEDFQSLPIVYLSAEDNQARQLQALERGADDFLKKPVDAKALVMSVKSRIRRYRELADLINRDAMTGLLKHSSFLEQAEGILSRSRRDEQPLAFVMLDIDWFKKVNDSYGHSVGDRVIKALAGLLRQSVRQADLVGRYGGEEFALVLQDCSAEDARVKMDELRRKFSSLEFPSEDESFNCSVSIGIAIKDRNPERRASDFIELADQALYQSKRAGRNRVSVFVS